MSEIRNSEGLYQNSYKTEFIWSFKSLVDTLILFNI